MGIMFQHASNKNKGRHNDQEHQHQHYVLYLFCMMMPIQNKGHFVLWAMCNAASLYDYGGSNIPTFFGIAITQRTLLNYVSKIKDENSVLTKARSTLKKYNLAICIFDNSQIVQPLKFQRFFKSAKVTLTTSRIFLQPYISDNMDDMIFSNKMPEHKYIDPNIPSPYGMPSFQDMDGLCAKVLFANKSLEPTVDIDMSGNRAWYYVKKIRESLQLHKFRWMLPMNHEKQKFLFCNETHYASMLGLGILDKLLKANKKKINRVWSGLLLESSAFQRKVVDTWRRSNIPHARVLIPP
eukprot:15246554-Ditylum_brightwellii.AAC.1